MLQALPLPKPAATGRRRHRPVDIVDFVGRRIPRLHIAEVRLGYVIEEGIALLTLILIPVEQLLWQHRLWPLLCAGRPLLLLRQFGPMVVVAVVAMEVVVEHVDRWLLTTNFRRVGQVFWRLFDEVLILDFHNLPI
jgi:hypothetical protein